MDPAARNVIDWLDRHADETVELLARLVSFPSVTGDEAEIQAFVAATLDGMGLEVDVWEPDLDELLAHPAGVPVDEGYRDRPNVVGSLPGSGKGRSLIFNGHVDVIPPGPAESWRHPPWGGVVEDGRIHGRGASDMKGGLAAMTMAVRAIQEVGVELDGDVTLEYTVDEELSGNGTLACILRGYRADAGICCETSNLHVQPACIGRIWFDIDVRGKPAGIQRRWEGVSAIDKARLVVDAVAELEERRIGTLEHPLFPDPRAALPCMVGVFRAGSYPSAFPDTALLRGSIATLPGEDSEAVKESLRRHVVDATGDDDWLRDHPPEVHFRGYFAEPAEIPTDHPVVDTVGRAFRQVTGRPPEISGRLGAADTRFLNAHGDTPTVIFGPGDTDQMHAVDEHAGLHELAVATKVLALSILDWCRNDRSPVR